MKADEGPSDLLVLAIRLRHIEEAPFMEIGFAPGDYNYWPYVEFDKLECANDAACTTLGEAFCLACMHRWKQRSVAGEYIFDCPSCKAHKGRWKFSFYPPDDLKVRECNCGNQLFYLTPDGHLCAECGIYQRY